MAQIDKKIVDCYWYLQNQCTRGEACEYRHWKAALDNPITCTDWQQGKCLNKECNFRHPSTAIANLGKKNTVCYYFTHGGCMKGSSCPYSHDSDSVVEDEIQKLAQIKKKEEQELKRLQEERLREEKRLAELKNQEKSIKPSPKLQKLNDGQTAKPKVKKASNASATSFAKSVGEIQQQSIHVEGNRKIDVKKTRDNQEKKKPLLGKRPTITTSEPPSKQTLDFGIKNLDELLKEKEEKEKLSKVASEVTNGVSTNSPPKTTTSPPSSKSDISIAQIRKRNEQKFKVQNATSEPQKKKSKTETTPTSNPPSIIASKPIETKTNQVEEEDVNIDDEFDKELNELETLI